MNENILTWTNEKTKCINILQWHRLIQDDGFYDMTPYFSLQNINEIQMFPLYNLLSQFSIIGCRIWACSLWISLLSTFVLLSFYTLIIHNLCSKICKNNFHWIPSTKLYSQKYHHKLVLYIFNTRINLLQSE